MLFFRQQKIQPPREKDLSYSDKSSYGSLLTCHDISNNQPLVRPHREIVTATQAQKGSLETILQLVSAENASHDPSRTPCRRCDIVAGLYLGALERLSVQAMDEGQIRCSQDLLVLMSGISQMLADHVPVEAKDGWWWFDTLAKRLWSLAKQLKDETRTPDCHVAITLSNHGRPATITVSEPDDVVDDDEDDAIRRAIRMAVYRCRAHIYCQKAETEKAIVYFRKCLAVCPLSPASSSSNFNISPYSRLRESAQQSLQPLLIQASMCPTPTISSRSLSGTISRNDSKASSSSSSMAACAHCGLEKRAMPVCAKCRVRTYCTHRCLAADKKTHVKECGVVVVSRPSASLDKGGKQ